METTSIAPGTERTISVSDWAKVNCVSKEPDGNSLSVTSCLA